MRMRKKKHGEERLLAVSSLFIRDGLELKGPVFLEIGCGKGAFARGLAEKEPEARIVAMEKISDVILLAAEALPPEIKNVSFLNDDARYLDKLFRENSVDRIYLNFSDPWPKEKSANKRLTSPVFLKLYDRILAPEGTIEFKTDNEGLFDYSLESIPAAGWELLAVTRDLHADPKLSAGNVMTEYEAKFSAKGNCIFKLIAARKNLKNQLTF